jgi:putative SOS response-associated peptidase YedK
VCGRYELHTHPTAIALAFGLAHPPTLAAHYNIAPTQDVPIVRINAAGERELTRMRWGFVPRWAKDPSIGARMINARCETIADKPAYRNAFQRHRCLLPADAFYEWKPVANGKQPMRVALRNQRPFGMAGLYERWLSPEGEVLDTCTIVTTRANELVQPMHERMPVMVTQENFARWLDAGDADVLDLFEPFPAEQMIAHPVSRRVNTVQNDDPSLIDVIVEVGASGSSRGEDSTSPAPPADGGADENQEPGEAREPVQPRLF